VVSVNSNTQVTGSLTVTSTGTFSSTVAAGGNFLIPAGSGLAWSGDATRIMTPEDNVSGALIQTPGIIRFNTSGSNRMTITTGGNVGIGTSSPDIFSRGDERNVGISIPGASDNLALALNAGGSAGRGAQIYMGQGGTRHFTLSSNASETRVGTSTSTPLILTTNDTTRLTIAASTGAATFSSTTFSVAKFNSTYGQVNIDFQNSGTTFASIGSGVSVTSTAAADDTGIGTAGLNKNIVFATGASYLERMRITSAGNVLINNTSDDSSGAKLQVTGRISQSDYTYYRNRVAGNLTGATWINTGVTLTANNLGTYEVYVLGNENNQNQCLRIYYIYYNINIGWTSLLASTHIQPTGNDYGVVNLRVTSGGVLEVQAYNSVSTGLYRIVVTKQFQN
jgi:hypothetical protein